MTPTHNPQATIDWLLDSDPSIRWQVMQDLTDEPAGMVAAERSKVATDGWGARLLSLQDANGRWGGGTFHPEWTSTFNTLALLWDMGLDPAGEHARAAVGVVRDKVRWDDYPQVPWADNPFFDGEVEPCINGRVVAVGSYFGQDVQGLVDKLLGEQLPDGGWNCEAENGSIRSSFHTTINVLEGFLEHERATGTTETTEARLRGEEYLLERRMFHRLSTGEVVDPAWTYFFFPTRWHYDVLRGLDYLRSAGVEPDERCAEAIELVQKRRGEDGRWTMHYSYPGEVHFDMEDGEGHPSRWVTLGALRCPRVVVWAFDGEMTTLRTMEPISLTVDDVTYAQLAGTIDHSLLKPTLTSDDIRAGCKLAADYQVVSVCVRPADVSLAASELTGTGVAVGTVVSFPHGASTTSIKVAEAEKAMEDGAVELDMVLNIGWLLSGQDEEVQADVAAVVAVSGEALVKVIFENAYLTDEQKIKACHLSEAAGADYVKTSTGYAPTGATIEDLRLMRANTSPRMKVKAAHGVRTLDALLAVIEAGVDRCGATATATILDDYRDRTNR